MGKGKTAFRNPRNQRSFKMCIYNMVSKKIQKPKKPDSSKQKLSFATTSVDVKKLDWFENSFLVPSLASFGFYEHDVKQRWSFLPVETKKKLEERFEMLQAKEECYYVSEKIKLLHEVASLIFEAD
ncbi:hypothetical protein EUTSA_v10015525mg [Eutrema salsugineum]|uniref:Glabrous enhancer-binding protein-like C-terminal domain-containing protein n=2 Tax=Eutrema salsugineum TaxID=72664 RepID=V4LGB6_EUTSA|nr:hypothetical protein EUTSA_v10015525mg [Eutrema salsugineum]